MYPLKFKESKVHSVHDGIEDNMVHDKVTFEHGSASPKKLLHHKE